MPFDDRICSECSKTFAPSNPQQKTCSRECSDLRRKSRVNKNLDPRKCDRCGDEYTPYKGDQRYCTPDCGREADKARTRVPPKTLEETLEHEAHKDTERTNASELRKWLAMENRMRRYLRVLEGCLSEYEPMPPAKLSQKKGRSTGTEWVVVLGDWHVGQKTRIEETGGIYSQDVSTVRRQVAMIWSALESIHAVESQGHDIQKLHVLGIGDFVDNDNMRPSQHRKVDDVITVQTIQAFDLLAWFIRQALMLVPEVEVDLVGGNHDRLSQRPGDAGLGELDYIDTVAWLNGEFLKRVMAADVAEGRLKIRNWQTFFGYKKISGMKVVFEHGSSFKWGIGSYGGVPWYGVQNLGPRYEMMLGGADLVILGHGHKAAVLPNGRSWVVVNGALPATSTYAQSGMKVVQRPLQWLLTLHERHGSIGWHPLYADPEELLLPGMIWEDFEKYANLASSDDRAA